MRDVCRRVAIVVVALGVSLPLWATTLVPLTLADLCNRSERIYHGTVLSAEPGSISVGGGTLPSVTYQIRIEEAFKGSFPTKGDASVVELTMLGDLKDSPSAGPIRKLGSIPGLPHLQVGGDYVLFTTPPSAVGLSTTVGLGTGCFQVTGEGEKAVVVNQFDNAGLFTNVPGMPTSGPLTYAALVSRLNDILGQ